MKCSVKAGVLLLKHKAWICTEHQAYSKLVCPHAHDTLMYVTILTFECYPYMVWLRCGS